MLGPDVLVAPVVEQGAGHPDRLLPARLLADAPTARRYRGPRSARTCRPRSAQLPYFVRCGTHPFR